MGFNWLIAWLKTVLPITRSSMLWALLVIAGNGIAQQTSGVSKIQGRVIEKIGPKVQGVSDAQVLIAGQGLVSVGPDGYFTATVPNKTKLKIEVLPTSYQILRPQDGQIPPERLSYTIEIYVLSGTVDSNLQVNLRKLDEEINRITREKKLSDRQIVRLEKSLLDTVLYYQEQRKIWDARLAQTEQMLEASNQANRRLSDSLQSFSRQINILQDTVSSLMNRLAEALEAKYVRQKELYEGLTREILDYESRLKDLQNWLPKVQSCYKNNQALVAFNKVCLDYSKARDALYNDQQKYLLGLQHYWDDPAAVSALEAYYQHVFSEIHDPVILDQVNQKVIRNLQDYSTKGIRKVSDTKRAADEAHEALQHQMPPLESAQNHLFEILKQEI
ncbi:MAG TPA: hypothetical protein PKY06_04720 [Saprospiraceae bacterium]|nr:hypothetical protein [Saprospiraceae bacterium]